MRKGCFKGLFSEYKLQERKVPLGKWLMPPAMAIGVLFLALIVTIFIQFRGKLAKIITKIFCEIDETGSLERCLSASENVQISESLLISATFLGLLAFYILVASSWFRRALAQIFFPFAAAFSAVGLYLHSPIAKILTDRALFISFISYLTVFSFFLFWIFFEIVSKDPLSALKRRWLTYWKLYSWTKEDPTILRALALGPLKLIYLDCFAIRCIECRKHYFYKAITAFNPMAVSCENCGFSIQGWAENEIRNEKIR